MAIIAMANLKDSIVSWNGKPRKLLRGELVTSIGELADLGEVDRKSVLRHLNYLVIRETIFVEKSFGGLHIKIPNFDKYQTFDAEGSQVTPIWRDSDVPNEGTHNEERKNKRIQITDANFETLANRYKTLFPATGLGPAKARFFNQITSHEKLIQLTDAIEHYRTTLDVLKWKQPKQTFATFLGTERSGFFWLDYINGPLIENERSPLGGMLEV